MDALATASYPLGITLCAYQAHSRLRAGLRIYARALSFVGALSSTLEFCGHDLAALTAGLVYVALFVRSEVTMARHGL
jgi:hypothetical protein